MGLMGLDWETKWQKFKKITSKGNCSKKSCIFAFENNGYVITLHRLDKLLGQAMKSGNVTIEETTITGIDKTEFEL